MTPKERILATFAFKRPDRIGRFDNFWTLSDDWRRHFGDLSALSDIDIWCPDEGAFPTRARTLKEEGDWTCRIDAWGRTVRSRKDAFFEETLEVPLPVGIDVDKVRFDPPDLDLRYLSEHPLDAAATDRCAFGKTGGPYLRTTFVRGETQFLMDIAADPPLARALADKMADHLAAVGVEEIRRWNVRQTGMSIWDDMAYNSGPMFSAEAFEKIFLPGYRRMIEAFKDAGARYVWLHSDGNILPILPMLIDAGIDGLNPLERRAGMDLVKLREKFPKLVLIGGMDNTNTLINGPISRIEAEAREIIDAGREGGVVIGTHSISPEIPLENFAAYDRVCRTYGNFSEEMQA